MMNKLVPCFLILAWLTTSCGLAPSDSELLRPKDDDPAPRIHDFKNKVFDLQLLDGEGAGNRISVADAKLMLSQQSSAYFTLLEDESTRFDALTPCFYIKLEQTGVATQALYVKSDASLTAAVAEADSFSMQYDSGKERAIFDDCSTGKKLGLFGSSRFTIRHWTR